MRIVWIGMLVLTLLLPPVGVASEALSDHEPSGSEILDCAFAKRFERSMAQVVDIEAKRGSSVVRRFRIQMASMQVDGHFRSLVFFVFPPDQRGMRVLTIERENRNDEHFVFVPFLDRVKRVFGGRRQESFLGTDFTYEDMERARAADFDAQLAGVETLGEDSVYVVSAVPAYESSYVRSEYRVARSDCSLLEARHFKKGSDSPAKLLSIPRERMKPVQGELMPTWAVARNLESGRSTELHFSEIQLDPRLSPTSFTVGALERMAGIPTLSSTERPRKTDGALD